jgi:glycosyltransferase involved in cell wall biosynthesis
LDSIFAQTYRDFELIISDDSSTNDVSQLLEEYRDKFPFQYVRNSPGLGSPQNWNHVISLAKGKWIKIMHHDDWFSESNCLEKMMSVADKSTDSLIFAGIKGSYLVDGRTYENLPNPSFENKLNKDPFLLLKGNLMGPPSCVLFSKSNICFDVNSKWLVDIDFYIRLIIENKQNVSYINEIFFENCMDQHNITNNYLYDQELQLNEYVYLLNKYSKYMTLTQKFYYFFYVYLFLKKINKRNSLILLIRLLKKRIYV